MKQICLEYGQLSIFDGILLHFMDERPCKKAFSVLSLQWILNVNHNELMGNP